VIWEGKMPKYNVWLSGYFNHESEFSTAQPFGEAEGDSFEAACDNRFAHDPLYQKGKSGDLFYWACELFDNEEDARKIEQNWPPAIKRLAKVVSSSTDQISFGE
jgi:hypothetical protein